MDTQLDYQKLVKKLLQTYIEFLATDEDNLRLLFDDEKQGYVLLDFGWHDNRYDHYSIIHVDIIGDKIWIQCDNTEEGIAPELVEMGVPKDKIVLGFRPPELRQYTGFAVS